MKKVLMIVGGIVLGVVILFVVLFGITYITSDKLVCKSDEGDITIMYNDDTITGYTANGISFDMDAQKDYVGLVGIEAYIEEFKNWFSSTTTGSCTLK